MGIPASPLSGKPPLTAAHFDSLIEASRQYHDLLAEFDKAETCGIACQQMKHDAAAAHARIQKMLGVYFPNGRPME